ncbi:MAG: substrate-binding domain-containing protein [Prevotella sp.]|nr:substrate-binding domain-containing protein [Bacteroides sp.]MCM1366900.1 substrate-binding domain-containing protein [Prevotella sp.]MCM1437445.1 substrate-binding domain-containing protein [Prevotella sp.]
MKYKIGVSQCSSDDWRNKMNDEIYREIMLHPEAEVEIRSADDNNQKQIEDIKYFRDNDFDIIIAAPNEADAITPVINEVYKSGIPVIVFDRDINGNSYTARQTVDNFGIGKAAAGYASHLMGRTANVLEIQGLKGSTPTTGRHNGFVAKADSLNLNILASVHGNWNHDDAAKAVDSLLNIYPDVDIIYAHNDRMAIAASELAKKHGRNIRIIGIDAAPEIGIKAVSDGIIDATFLYPTEGFRLIRTALAILKGQNYDKDIILPQSSAVDKSNADILILQNKSLIEETDKIKKLKTQVDHYWSQHSAQTALFYSAIVILILLLGILFMFLRTFWTHKRNRQKLMEQNKLLEQQRDTEKQLNRQLNAATQSKLVFFTNVSHDLRTPLTLIAEPIEQLAQADYLSPQHKTLINIANKNVKILRRLINQILDFRKYENGKLRTSLSEVVIAPLLHEWCEGFSSLARSRHIKLKVKIDLPADFSLAIDVDKIERVFFNILSNAFKYTPDNGNVDIDCHVIDNNFKFSITDTGKGISTDDLGNIFDRFYQVDKIHPNGSGIGLSLAKAFVELHGGKITVQSVLGKGSEFSVSIPVRHVENALDTSHYNKTISNNDIDAELAQIDPNIDSQEDSKPLLLIIDDNDDIRSLISQLLSDEFTVIGADNGKEGIRLASKFVPDIIICDVMMPVMDGLECCQIIKNEISTSHIPVLMLTACSMDEQRLQGYRSGADAYLPKPFNGKILRERCRNLINNRKRIKNLWESPATSPAPKSEVNDAQKIPPTQLDNEFYSKFIQTVNTELGNPDLNIDSIASKLGLGRSQFYRKIKSLTNYSPVELLRKLRLEKAREMILTTDKSISEIAYSSGFSTPAYFTRIYRENYGETPSELRRKLGHKS